MSIAGLLARRRKQNSRADTPQPCVPRGLRLGYEHVRLDPDRVKRYLSIYGQHGLAYTHLDKNYRHFEVGHSSSTVLYWPQ
jgi:hypothetical protein